MSYLALAPRLLRYRFVQTGTARSLPAYSMLAGATLAVASALDVTLGGGFLTPWAVSWSFGVGLGTGLLAGLVLGAVFRITRHAPTWLHVLVWLMVGGAVGGWLVHKLGVVGLLEGKDRKLALGALGASIAAGVGLFAAGLVLQPRRHHPQGWIGSLRSSTRVVLIVAVLAAAAGTAYVDRRMFVGLYEPAHDALRYTGLLCALMALVSLFPRSGMFGSGTRRGASLSAVLVVAFPFLTVTPTHYGELAAMLEQPFSRVGLKALRAIGDPDLDGYSAFLGGGDCRPFNPKVNPGASEIPGNGIDDNCRGGDAETGATLTDPNRVPIPTTPSPVSVVLITIDTLRADHLTSYGYKEDTAPGIDAWAKHKAMRFDRAYTSGGWTSLAISSMLRGVYPRRLKWTRLYETNKWRLVRAPLEENLAKGESTRRVYGMPIEEPRKPLPWWLTRRGMRTVAVVDDGFSEFLSRSVGMDAGFDEFIEVSKLPKARRDDKGTADEAVSQLKSMPSDQPFFMWVHFFGPHNPNETHAGVPKFGTSQEGRYNHEIAYCDRQLARLLRAITGEQRERKIAVILTADHGETFWADKRNHGIDLSEASINIPLFVQAPGFPVGSSKQLVSLIDIMPTVMGITETPAPPELDGRDLRSVLLDPSDSHRVVISELWGYGKQGEISRDRTAVMDGTYKLEWNLEDESKFLWRVSDRSTGKVRNLLGEVEVPHLEQRINDYLEENGRVDLSD